MYTVAVQRDFIAQHYLIGGDWGAENHPHSHHYRVELQLQGTHLDNHGFLVDIVDIERHLNELISSYRDQTLNNLPEFSNLNPSLEHFSRILCQQMHSCIQAGNILAITITLWENSIAWASYRLER